ncbi:guanine deaminase [Schizophyllum commune H4-8]|uniref:Guanine deaminase n=1 Tax=Schizophyllum commune (strain H4-8 / FGSC 9210) TaxID=578458 RepID=D8PSS3_SCHCM|nr:guanine deaminase [Schizophyllum commune H4-8]KAI5899576.1 guanine deaminase [Schizophyllum commune H4-8]
MRTYYGAVVNPQTLTESQLLPRCLLAVGDVGTIEWIVEDVEGSLVQETLAQKCCVDAEVTELRHGEFLMPGFVDTHTHAPQKPNIGSGQQYELLDWLKHVTFPMEAKFADVDFARRTYESVVQRIINCGTTTCCYYATLHLEASKILADIVHARGQRAFIGKCNMDRNSPDHYREASPEASLADTEALIAHITTYPPSTPQRVSAILTPRFAISCTPPLLSGLGTLAASDPALRIQTHISENRGEIAFTKELFPDCATYAHVYDKFGLLRGNTVLAHAIHLEPAEVALIKERNAGISHCPTSNFNLSSGVAPVGEYLDKGIKVGLGTDVSGGFSPSILNAVQNASIASKVIAMRAPGAASPTTFANRQLSVNTLLYLATLGGAQVCALDAHIGNFAPGKAFDALLVNCRNDSGNPNLWGVDPDIHVGDNLMGLLERFLFCGDDRNISAVYVQGRLIGGTSYRA